LYADKGGIVLKGFRDFVSRGSVVDLAVAVVIGTAFTAVISAVVAGFINPLVAAIFGEPDLTQVATFVINDAEFSIGLILDALFTFLTIALAVYFVVVVPMTKLRERRASGDTDIEPAEDIALLREIRDELRRRTV